MDRGAIHVASRGMCTVGYAMRRIWREWSLTIVTLGMFLLFLTGQSISGYRVFLQDQQEHGEEPISFGRYLITGHFVEATFENWESEFLQMGAYVLLTVWLRQKGSAESKSLDQPEPVDQDPREEANNPRAPGRGAARRDRRVGP